MSMFKAAALMHITSVQALCTCTAGDLHFSVFLERRWFASEDLQHEESISPAFGLVQPEGMNSGDS